jgi:hypothetical protein
MSNSDRFGVNPSGRIPGEEQGRCNCAMQLGQLLDVSCLTAIALAEFHRLRRHYQEVHAADHGYPRTRLAKWKGLRGH